MSFRARLRLFFALIVILPMIALALVLFTLTARSETGKVDAGIAAGVRASFELYREAADAAEPALRRVARDEPLRASLAQGARAATVARMRELAGGEVVSIELRSADGRSVARSGATTGVAPKGAPLLVGGRAVGTLLVCVTRARDFARRVRDVTGLDVAVFREGRPLASTLPVADARAALGAPGGPHDLQVDGVDYRGRIERIREPAGPPLEIAVFRSTDSLSARIADNRLLIGALLLAFLLLALASATFVSRALTGQIGTFLAAARRLARGDFAQPVPVQGRDEFAELGAEFNSMSEQLEAKIEEVERKRQELEETIRRVGDALATGLDRQGVVALAVKQAVDACDAEVGRALPLDRDAFARSEVGATVGSLEVAVQAAERDAFTVRPEIGAELLETFNPDAPQPRPRRAVTGSSDGAFALAVPMRTISGPPGPEFLGVISIARRGREFTREEEQVLEYLAGQAVVSIENATLHATVERQAVTDELTGLANVRALHSILDREIERSRRFQSPLGLVMVDLDNFKRVNDVYGHQQGDEVLAAVAGVLRDLSRDIDAPARYGGEELAVVVPQTDSAGAALLAERMRDAVERLRVPEVGGAGSLSVTASFGVAAVPDSALDKDGLIAAADEALYRAKRGGKNRVEQAETVSAAR
jgi:diguanylate cyclase (GGDEF)-like protein